MRKRILYATAVGFVASLPVSAQTISGPGMTTSGSNAVDPVSFVGGMTIGGALRSTFNGLATIQDSQATAGFAITNNYAGSGDVDFWNLVNNEDTNAQGFYFYQKTGSGTAKRIVDFYSTSTVTGIEILGPAAELFSISVDAADTSLDTASTNGFTLLKHVHLTGSLLQPKTVDTPATGATITMTANQRYQAVAPAGTIATLTLVLPPSPVDSQAVSVGCSQIVTTLTVNAGTGGAAIVGAPTTLTAGSGFTMVYQSSNNTWYRAG